MLSDSVSVWINGALKSEGRGRTEKRPSSGNNR